VKGISIPKDSPLLEISIELHTFSVTGPPPPQEIPIPSVGGVWIFRRTALSLGAFFVPNIPGLLVRSQMERFFLVPSNQEYLGPYLSGQNRSFADHMTYFS